MKSALLVPLYVGLVFVSGTVVGALGQHFYSVRVVKADVERGKPEVSRQRYSQQMQERLKLDGTQKERMQAILLETDDAFRVHREEGQAKAKQIRAKHVEKVRSMLTDAQRSEYEKLRAEWAEQRRKNKSPGQDRR